MEPQTGLAKCCPRCSRCWQLNPPFHHVSYHSSPPPLRGVCSLIKLSHANADNLLPAYKTQHPPPLISSLPQTLSLPKKLRMVAFKFLLALSLSLLVSAAIAQTREPRLTQGQQCRFQRISGAQPSLRLQSEGGTTELWDERQEQFQCAGVVAMRSTIRPNGLSLPNYHPSPRLVYIERGQGLISIMVPGCAETYQVHRGQSTMERTEPSEQQERGSVRDLHQKVHRLRQGDIVAIPSGASHWCYNDGSEDLVAVSINDVNHLSNQLDQKFRAFYLAGGVPRSGQQEQQARETFHNIFRAFDANLLSEAFNVPQETIRRMQSEEEERGLIVMARERMRFVRPDEEEGEQEQRPGRQLDNGLEESFCTMKFRTNVESRREADIFSRQAGRVNVVDRNKLPILKYMDLSAEKGNLYANALVSPDWSMTGHTIVYVTRGDAQIQVVDHNGQALMNDRVNQGEMFVVPQYYTSIARAGNNGFEWVAFKTTGSPMRSPLAGYTSVIRAMPLQVITNSYQISPNQAQALKMNRGSQSFLLSPGGRRS
ncbi:11S globulin seed storage protein 2 [Sesamum angolense]|uniref:11S globulin seed storage protein 2 n=1 Tax=Sesamum angolense TaxID=2727404 RepID=A0AAE1X8H2_9LAMI|nr:11S globulin seed storage protein 2 [Sesamum angolense]